MKLFSKDAWIVLTDDGPFYTATDSTCSNSRLVLAVFDTKEEAGVFAFGCDEVVKVEIREVKRKRGKK